MRTTSDFTKSSWVRYKDINTDENDGQVISSLCNQIRRTSRKKDYVIHFDIGISSSGCCDILFHIAQHKE